MFFKFIMFYWNFDSGVDMGDGGWCIRFVKYEFLIYYKINKIKYIICFIYMIVLFLGFFNLD